jgi:hypothetical protein
MSSLCPLKTATQPVSNGLGQGCPPGLRQRTRITPENDSSQGQPDGGYQRLRMGRRPRKLEIFAFCRYQAGSPKRKIMLGRFCSSGPRGGEHISCWQPPPRTGKVRQTVPSNRALGEARRLRGAGVQLVSVLTSANKASSMPQPV